MDNLFFDRLFDQNCKVIGCDNCPLKSYFTNMTSNLDEFDCREYAKNHPQDLLTYLELKSAALLNSSKSDAIGSEDQDGIILEEGQSFADAIKSDDEAPVEESAEENSIEPIEAD